MKNLIFPLILALAVLLAACGSADNGSSTADSGEGEKLFAQSVIGSQAGCATCHSLEPDAVVIGPSLAGIGGRAANIVAGQSAADYLKESITNPDAYVAEGFPDGIMPATYTEELTSKQVDQLVAYMLTLK